MKVKISHEVFNPWQEIQDYQVEALRQTGKFGATSIFIGSMRDYNEGADVQSMTLEYYPGMTEKQLDKVLLEAGKSWQLLDSLIIHRVGEIRPDETIVSVAVWSMHRGDAFDACRYIMETLKSIAPFWKKERLKSGQTRWVEGNTDGYERH